VFIDRLPGYAKVRRRDLGNVVRMFSKMFQNVLAHILAPGTESLGHLQPQPRILSTQWHDFDHLTANYRQP
jgi:hypothetical protein